MIDWNHNANRIASQPAKHITGIIATQLLQYGRVYSQERLTQKNASTSKISLDFLEIGRILYVHQQEKGRIEKGAGLA
jgi:hypothetical protein